MSDVSQGNQGQPGGQSQSPSLMLTIAQNIVTAINRLSTTIQNVWPRTTGSFTMTATSSLTVTQPAIRATSVVMLSPTNASAGTLMGSTKSLYVSAIVAGTGFTVSTASGVAAAGTEALSYAIFNPN